MIIACYHTEGRDPDVVGDSELFEDYVVGLMDSWDIDTNRAYADYIFFFAELGPMQC